MNEDTCVKHGEDISSLKTSVERFNKELFNGDGGLVKTVPVLASKVEQLTETMKKLDETIQPLAKFCSETQGSNNTVKNTVPWIAVLIAALTFVFTIYNNTRVNKVKEEQSYVNQKLEWKQDRAVSPVTRGAASVKIDSLNKK